MSGVCFVYSTGSITQCMHGVWVVEVKGTVPDRPLAKKWFFPLLSLRGPSRMIPLLGMYVSSTTKTILAI